MEEIIKDKMKEQIQAYVESLENSIDANFNIRAGEIIMLLKKIFFMIKT